MPVILARNMYDMFLMVVFVSLIPLESSLGDRGHPISGVVGVMINRPGYFWKRKARWRINTVRRELNLR